MMYLIILPGTTGNVEAAILLFVAIFLLVVSLVLLILERNIKRRIKELSLNKTFFYRRQIKEIKKYSAEMNAKQLLTLVNAISKSFFRDYLKLKREATYEELAEEFKKIGDVKKAKMCETLSELVYSRESVEKEDIENILDELEIIIIGEGIINEQVKKRKENSKKNTKIIKVLLKEGRESVDLGELKKAREDYTNISKLYKTISRKNQLKLRKRLIELYNKINNV